MPVILTPISNPTHNWEDFIEEQQQDLFDNFNPTDAFGVMVFEWNPTKPMPHYVSSIVGSIIGPNDFCLSNTQSNVEALKIRDYIVNELQIQSISVTDFTNTKDIVNPLARSVCFFKV